MYMIYKSFILEKVPAFSPHFEKGLHVVPRLLCNLLFLVDTEYELQY